MQREDDLPLFDGNSRTMTVRRRPLFIIAAVVFVVIAILLGTTIYYAQKSQHSKGGETPSPHQDVSKSTVPCPMTYFNVNDGVSITWYPDASTEESLKEALKGNFMMIGATVSMSDSESPVIGQFSLEAWLTQVMMKHVGIKLSFSNESAVEPALKVLQQHRPLNRTVYLSAKVMSVVETQRQYINRTKLFQTVNQLLPEVRLSLGIDSGTAPTALTSRDLESLNAAIQSISQPVTLEIDAGLAKQSWNLIRPWIVNSKDNDVILTQPATSANGVTEYDLLLIRNDCDADRLYYDMKGDLLNKFLNLCVTAESPMLSFGIQPRDASKIIWKHAVDSMSRLKSTLNDTSIMMIEADILMGNETDTNNTNIPIMAHPPNKTSDLSFLTFLNMTIPSGKGLKLDFKELEAVPQVLNMTNQKSTEIKVPVWLNADILQGPNGNNVTMTALLFLEYVPTFPAAILSLGWTTGTQTSPKVKYTMEMMNEMNNLCKTLIQPITFPIRAVFAKDSISELDWLLQQSRGYTLTIWTSAADTVTKEEMNFVQRNTEAARVYFDLPPEIMPDIYN